MTKDYFKFGFRIRMDLSHTSNEITTQSVLWIQRIKLLQLDV